MMLIILMYKYNKLKGGEIMNKIYFILAGLVILVAGIFTNSVASFSVFNQPKSPSMLVK